MKHHIFTTVIIVALVGLLVLLEMTNPLQSGPIGILTVLFLLYVVILGVTALLLHFIGRVLVKLSRVVRTRRPLPSISLLHSYYYATIIALGPIMLIGMGSVGKIDFREVLLVILFEIAACIYVRQRLIRSV